MPERTRKSHAKQAVRAATGREVADVLRELYVEGRHSDREIAEWLASAPPVEVDRSLAPRVRHHPRRAAPGGAVMARLLTRTEVANGTGWARGMRFLPVMPGEDHVQRHEELRAAARTFLADHCPPSASQRCEQAERLRDALDGPDRERAL